MLTLFLNLHLLDFSQSKFVDHDHLAKYVLPVVVFSKTGASAAASPHAKLTLHLHKPLNPKHPRLKTFLVHFRRWRPCNESNALLPFDRLHKIRMSAFPLKVPT